MKISFDLDNTLFDMEEVYKIACREYNVKYTRPKHWAVYDCYPKEVADRMLELFAEDVLYTMPIINKEYAKIVNSLIENKEHQIYFVTERRLKQPEKSYQQILMVVLKQVLIKFMIENHQNIKFYKKLV